MGLIGRIMNLTFGNGRNVVAETAQVFRENAENAGARHGALQSDTLAQFAAEFARPQSSPFDRLVDGLNRLPRPLLAFGTLGLFASAMVDPIWFASRMQGVALVPDPLWWLMGAIVSFYFGARHQAKSQDFQRSVAATMTAVPQVIDNIGALDALRPQPAADAGQAASDEVDLPVADPSTEPASGPASAPTPQSDRRDIVANDNAALRDWAASRS